MTGEDYRASLAAAEAKLAQLADVGVDDRAAARLNSKTLAQVHRNTDAQLVAYVEQSRRVDNLRALLRSAEMRDYETARVKMTADDVAGAVRVRTSHGWHRVVRVSAKSVTVETGYSWTDRIPFDKVLEVAS